MQFETWYLENICYVSQWRELTDEQLCSEYAALMRQNQQLVKIGAIDGLADLSHAINGAEAVMNERGLLK